MDRIAVPPASPSGACYRQNSTLEHWSGHYHEWDGTTNRRLGVSAEEVSVAGRDIRLSNLDKVLYPATGFTKAELIDYYVAVAPALLPRLAGRPVTLRRYPNGVAAQGFFAKNTAHHPDWVATVRLPTPGSVRGNTHADYLLVDDLPTLVWAANLAGIELHVPQWTVEADGTKRPPDLLVFDLDPGPGTDITHCCRVAELIRAELAADDLAGWPKTSGAKGLQLYVPIAVDDPQRPMAYARELAGRLARAHPELIVATIARRARHDRVLIDWSQNDPHKTTIAAYSLRATEKPSASTPVSWAEIERCRRAEQLRFTVDATRERLAGGDPLADLAAERRPLP
ncbi:MAG: non-homologous end-joining DNA ligase [Sciscionella sp.]|nr:non-homologous end-joining DNA ligase [Sciscionella sp.]